MKRFKRVYLELTNACNLSCSFCNTGNRPVTSLDPAQLASIISQTALVASEIRPHLLGEPLIYPHFGQFLNLCADNHIDVRITTNGLLIERHGKMILESDCVREVSFSLQSYHQDTHGSADQYLSPIFSFCDEAAAGDLPLHVNFRFWNQKEGVIPETHQSLIAALTTHYGTDIISQGRSVQIAPRRRVSFDPEFSWPTLSYDVISEKGFCYGAQTHIGILSDGTVVPCCLDSLGVINCGNIFTDDLSSITAGERLMRLSDGFKKGACVEELCKRCEFRTRFKGGSILTLMHR
jgi:MoaA/NifB/PqqE/SkfB family radical SAM enzyme